jgi:hypothetical protein
MAVCFCGSGGVLALYLLLFMCLYSYYTHTECIVSHTEPLREMKCSIEYNCSSMCFRSTESVYETNIKEHQVNDALM